MKIGSVDLVQKCVQAFPNSWIMNLYEHNIHSIRFSHDQIAMTESDFDKDRLAQIVWKDGIIVKDETGLFIKVSPTVHKQYFSGGAGGSGGSPMGLGGEGRCEITDIFVDGQWKSVRKEKKYDKGFEIKLKKCECGASAVGSNVHSGWCTLNG